jgi:formate hydrogenlyase transcriptional activator
MSRDGINQQSRTTESGDGRYVPLVHEGPGLRGSKEWWRPVFDNSIIGVVLSDPTNARILAANEVYQKMVGYTEEELRTMTFLDITPEEDRDWNWALNVELREGKREHYQIDKRYRRKDGRLIWVRFSVSLISSTPGLPRLQLALCEDITDRKLAEEALRQSEERSRKLLEINNAIITSLTEGALLQTVTEALGRVLPSDLAAVVLYQQATQTFRFLAAESSLRSDYFKPGLEYKRKESIAGWVVDHQRAVVRNDLEKEQRYGNDRRLLEMGLRSDCIVPLIFRGKTIGTLNVASRTTNHFSAAHVEFLQEVGNQVALAVANMQAYEEITALKVRLEKENVYLKEEIRTEHNFEEIVGNSPPVLELLRQVDQVAPTDSSILIYGETGTGKELIARAIHNRSPRKNRPLVKVNCAAIAAGLVESELFGHMKGAFTGAFERRVGRFELADRGTIFLDEIGELPMDTQVKLLRVLQEREFEPVGSNRSVRVDVRIIAATNRNLQEAVLGGSFRPDLFYRLNVFPLEIPALRDRPSDILPLAMFFLFQHSRKLGKRLDGISEAAKDRLAGYPWPGNVRELQNVIERAAILARGPRLELADMAGLSPSRVPQDTTRQGIATAQAALAMHTEQMTLDAVQRIHILAVLGQTGGIVEGPKGAAKALGLHPNTLRHRMEKLGIKRSSPHIS